MPGLPYQRIERVIEGPPAIEEFQSWLDEHRLVYRAYYKLPDGSNRIKRLFGIDFPNPGMAVLFKLRWG